MSVVEGGVAWLECRILCTHYHSWFQAGHDTHLVADAVNIFIPDADESECNSADDADNSYTQRLGLKATVDDNGTSIQCAAGPRCNGCALQIYYTRSALITVLPGMNTRRG